MHNQRFIYKVGNTYDCPRNWSWDVASMQDYDIWLVCAGRGELECGGIRHKLSSGDCFIFKPGASLKANHVPEKPLKVVAAHFEAPETTIGELMTGNGNSFLYRRLPAPELTSGALCNAIKNSRRNIRDMADFWLEVAVMSFFESSGGTEDIDGPRQKIMALCSEITAAPGRDWNIPIIAGKLHYSPDHCGRLFLKYTGMAPMEYVIRQRVDRACFLLKYSNLSMEGIADELCYSNVFYFSKQFKKLAGVPPSVYRRGRA